MNSHDKKYQDNKEFESWLMDSGVTIHVLKTDKGMTNIQEIEEVICVGNNSQMTAKKKGDLDLRQQSTGI